MTGMLDSVRDYAQNHPISVAAGLIVALPGTYYYITGKSITCAVGLCSSAAPSSHSHIAETAKGLSEYSPQNPLALGLSLPVSSLNDRAAPTFVFQILEGTRMNIVSFLTSLGQRLGVDLHQVLGDRWAAHYPLSRFVSVAFTTALPGAFLVFTRNHPNSWAAKHRSPIANALHIIALVTVANQRVSVQDVLVTALVMVSFGALQRALDYETDSEPASAIETLLSQTHSVVAKSDFGHSSSTEIETPIEKDEDFGLDLPTDERIIRLENALTKVKTAEKAKEHDLRRARTDLQNARDTLNDTFAEYSSLREEMKTIKQTIGRDHQAVIYRKDIELFALRKANEQKENYIKERDSKVEDIYRQQKATLELKEAQLRNLKERVAFLERASSPKLSGETALNDSEDDSQPALAVKLLRVRGRNSLEIEEIDRTVEEKDEIIGKLRDELVKAARTSETIVEKTQDELRKAWDASYEVQNALNEERQNHAQTQTRLEEANSRLDEMKRTSNNSSQKGSPNRLPTIEEQDKHELEAMFNAAQQDNLRLYTEVEALEKRVREANSKVFISKQEVENLREQLRVEQAINEDMETARPSLVHRVHYQRMEGQLKESRDSAESKDEQIAKLKKDVAAKERQLEKFNKEPGTTTKSETDLHEENDRLKKTVAELESTKEQLMLDHERLASQRARQRGPSAEHNSARSSGATLITEQSPPFTSDEPLPARPISLIPSNSIQSTPERHQRTDTNTVSLISTDAPPPELRTTRRKSLTLKGLMRKIAGKDAESEGKTEKSTKESKKEKEKEKERPKTALAPKDTNTLMRPKTSAAASTPVGKKEAQKNKEEKYDQRPKTAVVPEKVKNSPVRYYAPKVPETAKESDSNTTRPKTAAGDLAGKDEGKALGKEKANEKAKEGEGKATGMERPKSRGWSASRKLVRRSIA